MTGMIQPGATERIAGFAADFAFDRIPPEVMERARFLIIDFIASVIRAGKESDSTPSIIAMLKRMGLAEEGDSTVFGFDRGFKPPVAALLNGAFGHSLDFDDTHADSSLHPSAPVVPAAFAAAQMTGASGRDFVGAVVLGYEVCCRLGNALDPTSHYARGFHPTATAGTFGAAAAAGRLLGLDKARMISAFGVSDSQASGSLQFLVNGSWNKRYQVGEAAMKGLVAASLAAEGFIGSVEAIEGRHGLLAGYTDDPHPAKAVEDLGSVFETMKIGVKPYPSCRYTHAAIDGLLKLYREEGLRPDAIERVTIGLHRNGITLTASPLEAKRTAKAVVEGQFSMPFTAAVALYRGRFGWDDYALLGNPEVEAIAAKVDVVRDERLEGLRHPFGATLKVVAGGRTFEMTIPDPTGEPDLFPTAAQLREKFLLLARPVIGDASESLFDRLVGLQDLTSLSGFKAGPATDPGPLDFPFK